MAAKIKRKKKYEKSGEKERMGTGCYKEIYLP